MLILTFDATIWVQQKKSKLIFYDDLNNLKSRSNKIKWKVQQPKIRKAHLESSNSKSKNFEFWKFL